MFLLCWSSCDNVHSSQYLRLQCQLCMNIKDAYFDRKKYSLYGCSCVNGLSVAHRPFSLDVLGFVKDLFAYMCLETWDSLRIPNSR